MSKIKDICVKKNNNISKLQNYLKEPNTATNQNDLQMRAIWTFTLDSKRGRPPSTKLKPVDRAKMTMSYDGVVHQGNDVYGDRKTDNSLMQRFVLNPIGPKRLLWSMTGAGSIRHTWGKSVSGGGGIQIWGTQFC